MDQTDHEWIASITPQLRVVEARMSLLQLATRRWNPGRAAQTYDGRYSGDLKPLSMSISMSGV